jgi:hypothetical protein
MGHFVRYHFVTVIVGILIKQFNRDWSVAFCLTGIRETFTSLAH